MKLLGSTKNVADKDKNGENVPKLKIVEVVLVHCNLVKNDYRHTSKVLLTFVSYFTPCIYNDEYSKY